MRPSFRNSLLLCCIVIGLMAMAANAAPQWAYYPSSTLSTYDSAKNNSPLSTPASYTQAGGALLRTHCSSGYDYYQFCIDPTDATITAYDYNICGATTPPTGWVSASKYAKINVSLNCAKKCSLPSDMTTLTDCDNTYVNWAVTSPPTCTAGKTTAPYTANRYVACYYQVGSDFFKLTGTQNTSGSCGTGVTIAETDYQLTFPLNSACSAETCSTCNSPCVAPFMKTGGTTPIQITGTCSMSCACDFKCKDQSDASQTCPVDPATVAYAGLETAVSLTGGTCSTAVVTYTRKVICVVPNGIDAATDPYCTSKISLYQSVTKPLNNPGFTYSCTDPSCSDCGSLVQGKITSPFTLNFSEKTNADCACTIATCGTGSACTTATTATALFDRAKEGWALTAYRKSSVAVTAPKTCSDFDTMVFTRSATCKIPSFNPPGSVDHTCPTQYTGSNLQLSSAHCKEATVTCDSCAGVSTTGTGANTAMKLSPSATSSLIYEVPNSAPNVATSCACSCGMLNAQGGLTADLCPTAIAESWSSSPTPVCQSSKLKAAVAFTPDPDNSSCVQNGKLVDGDCVSITLPKDTPCSQTSKATSCEACGIVDKCEIEITFTQPALVYTVEEETCPSTIDDDEYCHCTAFNCSPAKAGTSPVEYDETKEQLCSTVNSIDDVSQPNTEINWCETVTKLSEYWTPTLCLNASDDEIECFKTTFTAADVQAELQSLANKQLTEGCVDQVEALCLLPGQDDSLLANYVPCAVYDVCQGGCSTGPAPAPITPRCLIVQRVNGETPVQAENGTGCDPDSVEDFSYQCTCTEVCESDPDFNPVTAAPAGNCATTPFTLPTDCTDISVPVRSVFRRLGTHYTKLSSTDTTTPLTRTMTNAEILAVCPPVYQCALTGANPSWGSCSSDGGFGVCDPDSLQSCGTSLSRQARCYISTQFTLSQFEANLTTQSSGAESTLVAQISAVKSAVQSECDTLSTANPTTKPCDCKPALFCLKSGVTGSGPFSKADFTTCALTSSLKDTCSGANYCSTATIDYTSVYCRNISTQFQSVTAATISSTPCSAVTFPTCAGTLACTSAHICNDDPETSAADLIPSNLGEPGYNNCDATDFSEVCYTEAGSVFTESACTDVSGTSYVNARAAACVVVDDDNGDIIDASHSAGQCTTLPTKTKADCIDYSGCTPAYIANAVIVSDAAALFDRGEALASFEFRGSDEATNTLYGQWAYVGRDVWTGLEDVQGVDATAEEVSFHLPRLDRSISTSIRVRFYVSTSALRYAETATFVVKRRDSCADGDFTCPIAGTQCFDPDSGSTTGIASCGCIQPDITTDNDFTSDALGFVCDRTEGCDTAASKCENGGYFVFDSQLESTTNNPFQCASTCTCPNGFDSDTDCASCSTNACITTNGVARTSAELTSDNACGCKACFPGFGGSACASCTRITSITINSATTEALALFQTGNETQKAAWFNQLVVAIAGLVKYSSSFVYVSPYSKLVATDQILVVFGFRGNCPNSSSFVLQQASDPEVTAIASAWKSSVTSASLQSQSSFTSATTDPANGFTVESESSDLATCQADNSCPSYAPALSCTEFPTHPSCQETENPSTPDNDDDKSNTTTIIIVVVVVVGVLLLAAIVIVILCCCCDSNSSASDSPQDNKKETKRESTETDHLELV